MAMWIEKSSKRKEIDDYFSSINCMSRRIVYDINELRQKCGSAWDKMTEKEQEKKIDQFMVPAEVKKNYPLPDTKDYGYIYPAFHIDTGQKLVEATTDQSESQTTWFDEFSAPFSCETKSQMDLRLPPQDGSRAQRRLSSQSENETKNIENEKMQETGHLDKKSRPSRKEKDAEKTRKKSTKSNKSKSSDSNRNQKSPIATEDNSNYNNSETEFLSLTSDLSKDVDLDFNFKFDDVVVSEILPSSELSKTYDESEFLDLYPQKPASTSSKYEVPAPTKTKKIEKKQSKELCDTTAPPSDHRTDLYTQSPTPMSTNYEISTVAKPTGPKLKKVEKKPSKERQDTTAPPSVLRQKKTHHKKKSSGTQQVNPRSSLTLDGAILNLEIAAEINKKGFDSQNAQEKREKVFNTEDDLLRQIEKNTDVDDWFTKDVLDVDIDDQRSKSTGFDFLDNW